MNTKKWHIFNTRKITRWTDFRLVKQINFIAMNEKNGSMKFQTAHSTKDDSYYCKERISQGYQRVAVNTDNVYTSHWYCRQNIILRTCKHQTENMGIIVCYFLFFICFLYLRFSFTCHSQLTGQQGKECIFNSFLAFPPASQIITY